MPERVVELAVEIAPEHVRQRLADLRTGRHGLREHGLGVGDLQRQDDGRAADRRWGEHAHFGELVGDVQDPVANS